MINNNNRKKRRNVVKNFYNKNVFHFPIICLQIKLMFLGKKKLRKKKYYKFKFK